MMSSDVENSRSHERRSLRNVALSVAKEVAARAHAVSPLLNSGCGLRVSVGAPKLQAAGPQRIRTTVGEHRQSPRGNSSCETLQGTQTAASLAAAWSFVGGNSDAASSLTLVPYQSKEAQEASADQRHYERLRLIASDAVANFAPLFIMAPLRLLSPWGALGGVSMAMMPPAGAPPGFQNSPLGMPGIPKEEEQFMELIFPGFDAGAFVWQMTMWQVFEFMFSMWLGHNRANPTPCVLYRLGASWGPAIARGQLYRLITPVFLHANLTHLLFNVFFQLRMGFGMEKQFGREKLMLIYFVCGIVGNLMSISVDPYKLAVGASTAGFGLIGVWLAEILLSWEILGPARERTVIWIVFMLISVTTMSTMTPNMDLWGHLGGAFGGFLLSIIISDMKEEDRPEWYGQARVAAAIGLALFVTGSLSKILLLGPRTPIPDCPMFPGLESSGLTKGVETLVNKVAALHAATQ